MLNRIAINQRNMTKTKFAQNGGSSGRSYSLYLYLKEISKIPLLSVQEEKALGQRVRSGDHEALQKLIVSNLRFVILIAKKFRWPGVDFQDLINEGNVGLIEAAHRFDPERNVRFTTYAVWWIRQAIQRHFSETSFGVRLPAGTTSLLMRVAIHLSKKNNNQGEVPDRRALAQELGVPLRRLNNILDVATKPLAFDQQIDDTSDRTFEDNLEQFTFTAAEKEAIVLQLNRQLRKSLEILTTSEQQVLSLRFGLNSEDSLTLAEIGARMNRSRERIRQIEKCALKKLRDSERVRRLAAYID